MEKENEIAQDVANREISISRLFEIRRSIIFKMWTEPAHIANWWAPKEFTTTITKMELKPGGLWELIIHGPDGKNYKNRNVFVEIKEPERIIFNHVSGPKYQMTAVFEEQSEKTLLSIRMIFGSARQKEEVIKRFSAEKGLRQNLEKLEEYLMHVIGNKSAGQ